MAVTFSPAIKHHDLLLRSMYVRLLISNLKPVACLADSDGAPHHRCSQMSVMLMDIVVGASDEWPCHGSEIERGRLMFNIIKAS